VTPPSEPSTPPTANSAPTAELAAISDRTVAGGGTQTIEVTYRDDQGVAVNSFGSGDIKVTGPTGSTQSVKFLGADEMTNGTPRVATYSVSAPGGSWDAGDNGTYNVALNHTYGVKDVDGVYADGQQLGSFNVSIETPTTPSVPTVPTTPSVPTVPTTPTTPSGPDTTPPQVMWSMFDPTNQTITMKFSEDVSKNLNISDLRLKNIKTRALLNSDLLRMSYDKATFTATWWFTQELPIADYQAIIVSPGLTDQAGNKLDGNGNGYWNINDDYSLVIHAADMLASAMLAKGIDPMAPEFA
jgi:hypothetical protein